jgi:hypothetical protein
MADIKKTIVVNGSPAEAFRIFVHEIHHWWPHAYTWSQDALVEMRIEAQPGGLCTEIGPHGFRCDWGRVIQWVENEKIGFLWQISPRREPVPQPEKASEVQLSFDAQGDHSHVERMHDHFERHGEGSKQYKEMMGSAYGWPYILECYQHYCNMPETARP